MTAIYTKQYRPISDYEVSVDDALTVRAVRDTSDSINNYVRYIASGVKLRTWFCIPCVFSADSTNTNENVTAIFCPVYVPARFNSFRVFAHTKRTTGAGTITWKVYSYYQPYTGPLIMDTTKIGQYDVMSWATNSDAWDDHTDVGSHIKSGKDVWFMLTSQNQSGSRGKLGSLDIVAYY